MMTRFNWLQKIKKWMTTEPDCPPHIDAPERVDYMDHLFPDEDASGRYQSGLDLPMMLKSSARRNTNRQEELHRAARSVRASLVDRGSIDNSQLTTMVRFLIASFWIGAGIVLHQAQTAAKIAQSDVTASGMPVEDAAIISATFFQLGGAAFLAVILLFFILEWRKSSLKKEIQSKSGDFGIRIARMLKEYDARLKNHRDALADEHRKDHAVDSEVSEAHVAAQEAMLLFEDVGFLVDTRNANNDDQMRAALHEYSAYLNKGGPSISASGLIEGLIVGIMMGFLFGILTGLSFVSQLTEYTSTEIIEKLDLTFVSGFEQYPNLLMLLLGGGLLFAAAGAFLGPFAAMIFAPERKNRRRESLNEIRGAVTAEEAPRAADIARRVEDLSEIFRVRLIGRNNRSSITNAASKSTEANPDADDDIPSWRRPKEGPRFVDPGYEMAPPKWRTDAFAEFSAKKSASATEAKRSLLRFKKQTDD